MGWLYYTGQYDDYQFIEKVASVKENGRD